MCVHFCCFFLNTVNFVELHECAFFFFAHAGAASSMYGSSPISTWQPSYTPAMGGIVDSTYPAIGSTYHYQAPCARIPPYTTATTQCLAPTMPPPPQYSEVRIIVRVYFLALWETPGRS